MHLPNHYRKYPIPHYGDIIALEDFIASCNEYAFTNDDGHGFYGTDTELIRDYPVDCSNIVLTEFPNVIWFNK